MKLSIPKPITEIDLSHEEVFKPTRRGYMPDYERNEYPHSGQEEIYVGNGQYADGDFRTSILEDCVTEGLIPGTVVVHKKIEMSKRIDPLCWGIVTAHNSATLASMPWKPLRIRWLSGSYEDLHATDLLIMMNVPDKSILKRRALGEPDPRA